MKKIILAAIIALGVAHAESEDKGTFVKEEFSCEVVKADIKWLNNTLETTIRTDSKYPMYLEQYNTAQITLRKHKECTN